MRFPFDSKFSAELTLRPFLPQKKRLQFLEVAETEPNLALVLLPLSLRRLPPRLGTHPIMKYHEIISKYNRVVVHTPFYTANNQGPQLTGHSSKGIGRNDFGKNAWRFNKDSSNLIQRFEISRSLPQEVSTSKKSPGKNL